MHRRRSVVFLVTVVGLLVAAAHAAAQSPPQSVTLPTVTVTAQKEAADPQTLPVAVTTVRADWMRFARVAWISDALVFAPNVISSDFSVRKLSNPRIRGLGASPGNPAVTTYLDGVPILNANASSIEFAGVEQVEFVRGPQSALFGRNALGGVINVLSGRPSLSEWQGEVFTPLGNYGTRELRGTISGPINDRVALGLSAGHAGREGFTVNTLSGNDVDARSATFAKAQLLFAPSSRWETRIIASGERAEDGDYALNDLAEVRRAPFRVARDFEGFANRDLFNTTVLNRYEGDSISVTSTTGLVRWDTEDETDLDYSPLPLARRSNVEDATQFTQEVRIASAPGRSIALSPRAALRWQGGVTVFTHDYGQEAVNSLAPFVLSPQLGIAVQQTTPRASLDDRGVGLYGQGTVTFADALDVIVGARFDYETKDALLETFFTPGFVAPPVVVDAEDSFANVSPQFAVSYRLDSSRMLYASAAKGFKAGGFNPASPAGREAYGEEHSWNVEGGLKTTWAAGRVAANAAVFFTDWNDLQLNVPNPQVPAQFFIANVGSASSRGVELELSARPLAGVDVFSAFGYTRARFGRNTSSNGVDVSDKELPFTPNFTFSIGAQVTRAVTSQVSLYGRGEYAAYGAFHYDESNTASQDAYGIANLRAGVSGRLLFGEVWVRNAFDTHYIPVALPYPGLAPSGFLGEPGRPRTFGINVGVTF